MPIKLNLKKPWQISKILEIHDAVLEEHIRLLQEGKADDEIYQIYDKFKEVENISWWQDLKLHFEWLIKRIKHRLKWLKWGWQRAKRGYSLWDLGNFDCYLFEIIANGLEEFLQYAYHIDEQALKEHKRIIELCRKYIDGELIFYNKEAKNEWDELFELLKKHWRWWWI